MSLDLMDIAKKIPRRNLGNTDISLPVLGFGMGAIGGAYGEVEEDIGIKAIHLALKVGINFLMFLHFMELQRQKQFLERL